MRFFSLCVSALSLLSTVVLADQNPIIFPGQGATLSAGQTYSITWQVTTSAGSVTLGLRYGAARNLVSSSVIAVGVPNSGSASWTVPSGIGNGQWAIQIVDSAGNVNYSPIFNVVGGSGTQGVAAVTSTLVASTATFTPIITGAIPTSANVTYAAPTLVTTTISGTVMTVTKTAGSSPSGAAAALSGHGAMLGVAALGAVAALV